MIRIAALNDSYSSTFEEGNQANLSTTKEAKEAEAFSLYHKALSLLRHGETDQAESTFSNLIQHVFIQEALRELEEDKKDVVHPGLQLLYSIHKNMAALATAKKDYNAAMVSYLEAVKIDTSEVTVWYKMGMAAMKIEDFQLAKLAFVQGLQCNPHHWPCLDTLISILYSLNNYWSCLYYISQAFEMDPEYQKGVSLMLQMFKETPCLREDTMELFKNCDKGTIYNLELDPQVAQEYVDEALAIRKQRQEASKASDPPQITFPKDLQAFSWKCVGTVLMDLFDKAVSSQIHVSLFQKVAIPDFTSTPDPTTSDSIEDQDTPNNTYPTTSDSIEDQGTPNNTYPTTSDSIEDQGTPNNTYPTTSDSIEDQGTPNNTYPTTSDSIEDQGTPNNTYPTTSDSIEDQGTPNNTYPTTSDSIEDQGTPNNTYPTGGEQEHVGDTVTTTTSTPLSPAGTGTEILQDCQAAISPSVPSADANISDVSKTANIEPFISENVTSQEMETDLDEFVSNDTKMDSPPKLPQITVSSEIVEDSDSVLEALSTAHLLLDSLNESPPKSDQSFSYKSPLSNLPSQSSNLGGSPTTKNHPVAMVTNSSPPIAVVSPQQKAYVEQFTPTSSLEQNVETSKEPSDKDSQMDILTSHLSPLSHSPQVNIEQLSPVVAIKYPQLSSKVSSADISHTKTSNPPIQQSSIHSHVPLLNPSVSTAVSQTLPACSSPLLSSVGSKLATTSCTLFTVSSSQTRSPVQSSMNSPQIPPLFSPSNTNSPGMFLSRSNTKVLPSTLSRLPVSSTETAVRQESEGFVYTPSQSDAKAISADHPTGARTSQSPVTVSSNQGRHHGNQSLQVVNPLPTSSISPVSSVSGTELGGKSPGGGKRGQKRRKISLATEEIMMYGKRRSARVRNTSKKKEEEMINFHDLLQAFLPSSLKCVQADEEMMELGSEDSPQADNGADTTEKKDKKEGPLTPWEEGPSVRAYLVRCMKNAGLLDMMTQYLVILAQHSQYNWPAGLYEIYLKLYCRARENLTIPKDDGHPQDLQEIGNICLVWGELQLDQWSISHDKDSPKSKSPSQQSMSVENLPKHCMEDLEFLTEVCACSEKMGDQWLEHCIRVYWMKARFYVLLARMDEAIFCYEKTLQYIVLAEEEGSRTSFQMPNCTIDNLITFDIVKTQQESLQRCQSLEETQRLHLAGEHRRVIDFLLQTFTKPKHTKLVGVPVDVAERRSQLLMLQDSLYELEEYSKCIYWGEESYNEVYQKYKRARSSSERSDWVTTMIQIFTAMLRALEKDITTVKTLPSGKLVRFAQNLVKVIDINMSLSDAIPEMTVDTVLPWILLYQLIKHEELKFEGMQLKDSGSSDSSVFQNNKDVIPSSHMLLSVAHDYLGSRGWCTKSEGALLLFYMGLLKDKLYTDSRNREEFQQTFEQCVFCLYGHPNKKGRVKHLQDHNVTQIPLKWENTGDLFDYFKPKTLPEFDSYKAEAISGEVEALFKRMVQLVPENLNMGVPMEEVQNYIEGLTSTPPSVSDNRKVNISLLEEIYYLLADYHLKNSEAAKAVKFYMLDICMNPLRLDSWAGMALARMSQLEQKLSSTELKMDVPMYKKSIAALRCFRRAVELDETNSKLWIEYGSLAYQLHSHSSRQLALVSWFTLGEELLQIAQDSRQEMLQIAYNCYQKASECEAEGMDEEWLLHYMMGKCLEKMKKPATEYLLHYAKAAHHLHEDHANYPKKIVYAYTTPRLAVEALEIHYRIHVCILKKLLEMDPLSAEQNQLSLFVRHIHDAASSPFTRRSEKGREKRNRNASGDTASSGTDDNLPEFHSPTKKSDSYQVPSQDHTYVKQKSSSNSCFLSDQDTSQAQVSGNVSMVTTMELHSEQTEADKVILTMTEAPTRCVSPNGSQHQNSETIKVEAEENSSSSQKSEQKQGKVMTSSSNPDVHGSDEKKPVSITDATSIKKDLQTSREGLTGSVISGTIIEQTSDTVTDTSTTQPHGTVTDTSTSQPHGTVTDTSTSQPHGTVTDTSTTQPHGTVTDASTTQPHGTVTDTSTSQPHGTVTDTSTTQPHGTVTDTSTTQPHGTVTDTSTTQPHGTVTDTSTSQPHGTVTDTSTTQPHGTVTDTSTSQPHGTVTDTSTTQPHGTVTDTSTSHVQSVGIQGEIKMETYPPVHTGLSGSAEKEEISSVDPAGQKCTEVSSGNESDQPSHRSLDDIICEEMKRPVAEIHKDLIDGCKKALELCLSRFPTHYKSHYRLAYLYHHSPYHRSLEKSRDVLLGVPKWQSLSYMPVQGLFADRKQTNFFQGIWKIPIDEIDRSGSFPSHLNKCIRLLLETLLVLKDSTTLHQIHLQLNRSPESGKKYLRDAEKKCFAKLSYEYTLNAIEKQIELMKMETDISVRIRFIMNVYRVWEHGVHKLGLHVNRINQLFSESYRIVTRKLEVLPASLLLEHAQRFCKQQLSLSRPDKGGGGDYSIVEDNVLTSPQRKSNTQKMISLSKIGQSTNGSLLKGIPHKQSISSTVSGGVSAGPTGHNTNNPARPVFSSPGALERPSNSASESPNTASGPTDASVGAASVPTVKIKMGLLQAAKMLKKAPKADTDTTSMSSIKSVETSDQSDIESSEVQSSRLSSQDSSSDTSQSSSDESSTSDSEEEEENRGSQSQQPSKQLLQSEIDTGYTATDEDEDEYSEEDKEEDEREDKDDDVILLSETSSEDEYVPKGRAVIPSPIFFTKDKQENATEILVTAIPSPVPLITCIMSSAMMPVPCDTPSPAAHKPIPSVNVKPSNNATVLGSQEFPMEIDSD